jgi:hypothetical protein
MHASSGQHSLLTRRCRQRADDFPASDEFLSRTFRELSGGWQKWTGQQPVD